MVFWLPGRGRKSKRAKAPAIIETTTGPIIEHEPLEEPVSAVLRLTHQTGMAPVEGIERRADGKLRVSQRRLADAMGEGRRTISQKLEELAQKGKIALEPTTGWNNHHHACLMAGTNQEKENTMSYESPFPHNPAGTPEEEIYNAHFFLKMMEPYLDLGRDEDPEFRVQALHALHEQAMTAVKAVLAAEEGRHSSGK